MCTRALVCARELILCAIFCVLLRVVLGYNIRILLGWIYCGDDKNRLIVDYVRKYSFSSQFSSVCPDQTNALRALSKLYAR